MAVGHIHFLEYNTWEPEKAKAFYGSVSGWTFQDVPSPSGNPYTLCMADGQVVAGMFTYTKPDFEGARDFWLTYIAVENADATAAKITEAGGHVRRHPFDVPNFGRLVVCDDSLGVTLGFIQPA